MPQALPFFFTHQAVVVLGLLGVLIYLFSVYLLPPYLHMFVSRIYVTKI